MLIRPFIKKKTAEKIETSFEKLANLEVWNFSS